MTRSLKTLGFLLVAGVGIWGCAKAPTESGRSDKNPTLEARAQRLEEDFRAAATARDQFRQKLQAAEDRQVQLQRQLDQARNEAAAEREALKAELKARLTERDSLAIQFEGFRKNLKDLIGQAESSLAAPSSPGLVGPPPPTQNGSALSN